MIRPTDGTEWETIVRDLVGVTEHVVSNLDPCTSHQIRVTAHNEHGHSQPTAEALVEVRAGPPAPLVMAPTVRETDESSVTLEWQACGEVEDVKYLVERLNVGNWGQTNEVAVCQAKEENVSYVSEVLIYLHM